MHHLFGIFLLLRLILVSDFYSSNLSADGLWKFINKLNYSRIFIRSGFFLNVLLKFFYECVASLALVLIRKNDCCLDDVSANAGKQLKGKK